MSINDRWQMPAQRVVDLESSSLRPLTLFPPRTLPLIAGDPDFATPAHIVAAMTTALEEGYTHYVDYAGDARLRELIAERLALKVGHPVSSSDVLMTHGSSAALAASMLAVLNPNDRVVIPEPTYSLYADIVRMAGAEPVLVRQTADFHLDLDALAAAMPGARMVVICHPSNPTGVVYRREELEALAELAEANDALIVSDEAYDHLIYEGRQFISSLDVERLRTRLIYCQTFSKTYAMTGWRIGYLFAPRWVVVAADRIHRTINGCLNAAVQRAAISALTGPDDWMAAMLDEYTARRELVISSLGECQTLAFQAPEATFYAFVGSSTGRSSDELTAAALRQGVAVRPGNEFGPSGEGFIRITFTLARQQLEQALARLKTAVSSLE